jgi:hypothetical protein
LLALYVVGCVRPDGDNALAGFNTGYMIYDILMLVGGLIGVALLRPGYEAGRGTAECHSGSRNRVKAAGGFAAEKSVPLNRFALVRRAYAHEFLLSAKLAAQVRTVLSPLDRLTLPKDGPAA